MLPFFVILRLVAARIYASGILTLVQTGKVNSADLAPIESETLERLGLQHLQPEIKRHFLVRFITWTGTRMGRIASIVVLGMIWFTFVAQIYITEFLQYHGGKGWLNQPLVQLPWFHYVPARLQNPMGEVFFAVLLLCLALLIRKLMPSKKAQ